MSDQVDDEMREIEERRAMEESGELPQPPSPRPLTPVPIKNRGTYRRNRKFELQFEVHQNGYYWKQVIN